MIRLTTLRFALLFVLFFSQNLKAQTWTWMAGPSPTSGVNTGGTYTNQGVASTTNVPGSKIWQSSWTDLSGNFWLFGGFGFMTSTTTVQAFCNDLWKYSPATNQWTWMTGSSQGPSAGVYGTLGVPASSNTPGSRYEASSWTDNSGNLWLFGGVGWGQSITNSGALNDLWKYTPSTNQWTWMKGSNTPNQFSTYGSLGVSSSSNTPGGRTGAVSWTDASGNFYLFGGLGYGGLATGNLNDLWKYDPVTNEWTWIGGSLYAGLPAVYGTKGVSSSTVDPGGRYYGRVVSDASGNAWMFGGKTGSGSSSNGLLNDLWKYDNTNGEWAWMSGSQNLDQVGLFDTQGVPSTTACPGARYDMSLWNGGNGYLYVLGGNGYGAGSTPDMLNDLWRYNLGLDEWTWMSGSTTTLTAGVYGTQGVASLSNTPGARTSSSAWNDGAGNLWMFGGGGSSSVGTSTVYLNDLWKYEVCSTPQTPTNLVSSSFTVCTGNIITLSVSSQAPVVWRNSSGTSVGSGTTFATQPLTGGTQTFYANAQLCQSSATIPVLFSANVSPTVSLNSGSICSGNSFTLSPSGATSYTLSGSATVVSPVNTSTYLLTGFGNGCPSVNTVVATVSVYVTPTVAIAASPTICSGLPLNMSASGANSYTWNTGALSSSVAPTASLTTTYSVVGESLAGCRDTAALLVTVYQSPTVSLTVNSSTICAGESFTITPSGANTYNYSGGNSTVTPSVSTVYTVMGSSSQGCLSLNAPIVSIQIKALPTLTLSGANSVCLGSSVSQLISTSAISYTWSDGSHNTVVVLTPTNSGICSVTVTGSNGCETTVNKTIAVNALPTVIAWASSLGICAGNTLILSGQGASTYSWSNGILNNSSFNPTASAVYTLTGMDLNGCANTATLNTVVYMLPVISAISSAPLICEGESATLTASGALLYYWNALIPGSEIAISPATTTTYNVVGTDEHGCEGSFSITQLVDACTAVKKNSQEFLLSVYPNPNKGEFTLYVDAFTERRFFEIYNALGELIASKKQIGLNTQVDLKDQPNGIYTIILIEGGRKIKQLKVIKD